MKRAALALAVIGASTAPALAHVTGAAHDHGSFLAGFAHPFSGADHMLAMVAVGLWAAMLGGRALLAVPSAFVGVMLVGFAASLAGMPLPFVEPAILASVVVLGLVVALAVPVPASLGAAVVGFFALFHGYAHGGEIGSAGFAAFGAGFALATALLHAAGIGAGIGLARLFGGTSGTMVTRVAGGATALGGLALAFAG